MEKLSEADERRILAAMERVIDATNGGADPSAAIAKVAADEKFAPPVVQRMVEAYNVSKTNAYMKEASGEARAASFPIADAAKVLGEMYPAVPKAARARELEETEAIAAFFAPKGESVDFFKIADDGGIAGQAGGSAEGGLVTSDPERAAAHPFDPAEAQAKKIRKHRKLEKDADDARVKYAGAFSDWFGKMAEAVEYFKRPDHISFAEVENRISSNFGALGKAAMDAIHVLAGGLAKRAEAAPYPLMVDIAKAPYRSIVEAMSAANEVVKYASDAAAAAVALEQYDRENGLTLVKPAAGILVSTKDFMEALGVGSDPTATRARTAAEVMAPGHETQMRAVKVQAMINDLVSNDPVLSAHDPNDVADAYNQIAQLVPHVASQPVLMRGLLRRVVQQGGVVEPHELKQVSDLEKQKEPAPLPLGEPAKPRA